MAKRKIDVFISSTSIDLPAYRLAVRDAILSLDFFPNGMENWPVSGENPVALCKKMVEDAEIYLGIYAHRYGWKPEGYDGKSITELEYDWAGDVYRDGKPIPRLCFIMRDDQPWPKDKMEVEAEADLKRFKAKVKANQVGFFSTPDDLKAQVTVALANIKAVLQSKEPMTWEAGASFDNYTLRDLVGTGGNGQVWRTDERLPDGSARQVAVKVLRAGISDHPTRVERFKREISNMARIDHTHIVPVYTYGDRGGQLYVIMRYLSGGTLRSRLKGQPIPEAAALRWLEQIGAALDYVHDRHHELIHRDVKPENILLDADGETLYLADFGLVFSAAADDHLTDEGKPAGTGRYMAPEQWRGKALSRRTDLYALGILAYELLTGHLPFEQKNDLELGNAHCSADLPADRHLSDEVLRILQQAAAKDPAQRYPTARAFLTDLRNWREHPTNLEPRIRDYLKWVTDELYDGLRAQFVELAGAETMWQRRPELPKAPQWEDDDDLFARASARVYADHIMPEGDGRKAFVENVRERLLTLERAVLVGEPGSGKTWMLQRLQADYARTWLKGEGERRLIPVLVRLNKYTGGTFTEFVKTALDTLAPYHEQLLREKRLVLLCDALNEMPRGAGQMRELIAYLKSAPYFVVSCRVRDYRDDLGDLKPLEQVLLHDLELPAIQELVHKRLPAGAALWEKMGGTAALITFWQKVQDAAAGEKFWDAKTNWWRLKDFYGAPREWHTMHSGARLIPLARNPYMGDLLCRTYQESGGTLPDSRAELFGKFIGQMLSREAKAAARRGESFPDVTAIQGTLIGLARALQASQRTVIAHADAVKALTPNPSPSGRGEVEILIRAALDANILSAQSDDLKFAHQLLQEYFAAKVLLELLEADEAEKTQRRAADLFGAVWWDAGVWRETIVILGEFLGEGARGANRVARWLAPVTPEAALEGVTRSAAGLTLNDLDAETRAALIVGAHGKANEPDAVGRAAAYRVLGLLKADQREGIGLRDDGLPDIDWVEIPAGEFVYGEGNEQQRLNLDRYWIARYPITFVQYQAFLDAPDGFEHDEWWDGLEAKYRKQPMKEQYFKYANHPRENVSWFQAVAFTRWLNAKYQALTLNPSPKGEGLDSPLPAQRSGEGQGVRAAGWQIRLPTEAEWQKAARGTDGLIYPYGNEFDAAKGNTGETGIGQTSAVGLFPDGASPYGVLDMSGNVWEWCATKWRASYADPADDDLDGADRRVVRGGSWGYSQGLARAASRDHLDPNVRYYDQGFRVAVSSPNISDRWSARSAESFAFVLNSPKANRENSAKGVKLRVLA